MDTSKGAEKILELGLFSSRKREEDGRYVDLPFLF